MCRTCTCTVTFSKLSLQKKSLLVEAFSRIATARNNGNIDDDDDDTHNREDRNTREHE